MDKKQFESVLNNTPGLFKSKLDRIRNYLYLNKASVMIGAGFSRNADFPPHIKVKQWTDVGKDIYCKLQSAKEPVIEDLVFKTPMRLASQFAATFGRNELDNFIKESIPDSCMYPGALHKQLLSLPWKDVFTTNYDTLLERGCYGLERSYSVITSKEMLLYKRSPRIIKLHGSFPDKTPFVMTEEDFRTYQSVHPEFVNTVRQALVESIFCLIGFSGDDPNFTSWIGWLHDVMGDYAGPSYLITFDKNYDESFKVLMAHRGVDVINFKEIDGIGDHKEALDFFFTYLGRQSLEWNGVVSYNTKEQDAELLIKKFKEVRISYPGWFILPQKYYCQFSDMEQMFPNFEYAFSKIDDNYKEALLNELDWRADVSLTFKDFDWFRKGIEDVLQWYKDSPMTESAINIALSLLKIYRYHPEKSEESKTLRERLSREQIRMTGYQESRYHYIVSCNALSVMDFDCVEEEIQQWHPSPSLYEGIIYKALVLVESMDVSSAVEMLEDAYERITRSLSQNNNIKDLSLRYAIEALLALYHHERLPETDKQFSFIDIRNHIMSKVFEPTYERFEIMHGYGVGSESRSWHLGGGIVSDLLYPYRCLSLYEAYGMPYNLSGCPVDEKLFTQILPRLSKFGFWYSFGVILRCVSRELSVRYFNRVTMNGFAQDEADKIVELLLDRTALLSKSKSHLRRETEVLLPILSHMASSCSQDCVIRIFKYANAAYRKSLNAKRDDLNLIYSCLFPDSIQKIYQEVFSSEIFSDMHENDIPLPTIGYQYYIPEMKEIEVVRNGLRSDKREYRESAYYRAEYLLTSTISSIGKDELEQAIIKWREVEGKSRLTRHSYMIVKCSFKESSLFQQMIEEDFSRFVNGDYLFNGSSAIISSFAEDLHNLTLLSSSYNSKQIDEILEKITDVLTKNFDIYSKDDSSELMGGFRHFTIEVFKSLEEFVKLVCGNGYSEVMPCKRLFTVLEKYMSSHLSVRLTMERLNSVSRLMAKNRMRDMLSGDLFSENQSDVIDSCNALISFSNNSNNIQTVLQNIIFYCNHAGTDKMRLYLQTLSLIPYRQMTQVTKKQLGLMLTQVLTNIPKQEFSEEQKVDIMHDGVRLAASLRDVHDEPNIEVAVRAWAQYAENKSIYNDVRQPWYIA